MKRCYYIEDDMWCWQDLIDTGVGWVLIEKWFGLIFNKKQVIMCGSDFISTLKRKSEFINSIFYLEDVAQW